MKRHRNHANQPRAFAGPRQDLAWAVKVLFEEFEAAVAHGTSAHKRGAEILKIVLFGSYATGKWVSDPLGAARIGR